MDNGQPPVQPEVQVTPTAQPEITVTLDDLFGNTTPAQPAQPAQPATPSAQPAAGELSDEQKIMNQVNQTVNQATQQFNTTAETMSKQLTRQQQLVSFFNSDAGKMYQPFMQQISQVATDPRFLDIKLDRVVGLALTPDVIIKMGAKMASEAENKSNTTTTGGNGNATPAEATPVDYGAMDSNKFAEIREQAKSGKFVQKS